MNSLLLGVNTSKWAHVQFGDHFRVWWSLVSRYFSRWSLCFSFTLKTCLFVCFCFRIECLSRRHDMRWLELLHELVHLCCVFSLRWGVKKKRVASSRAPFNFNHKCKPGFDKLAKHVFGLKFCKWSWMMESAVLVCILTYVCLCVCVRCVCARARTRVYVIQIAIDCFSVLPSGVADVCVLKI